MASLQQHAKSSVLWNAGFVVFRELLLKFGVVLIMRRLLLPEAYGQCNLVNAVVGFIAIFSFNNFVAYIVQVREEKDAHLQDQFTAGGVIQVAMFGVTNLVALGLRWLPQYAPVAPLVHVMSVVFLCEWPCNFCYNYLSRSYDWKTLRLLHAVGIVLSQVLALILAYSGSGVYALLVPGLVVVLPFAWHLFIRLRWRPTWEWSWAHYRPAWKFGLVRIGSGLAYRGRQLLENGVLVALLGFGKLGYLSGALGLAQMATQTFAEQLLAAIYPVLTRVNPDPHNISRVNGLVLRIVAWVAVPLAVMFSALAAPLVLTIYGAKWREVIPLLPWAMAVGAATALSQSVNTLLLSQGQLRRCLIADVLTLVGSALLLLLVLPYGLTAYLAGVAGMQLVLLALMLFWLVQARALKWAGIWHALLPVTVASAVALGVCLAGTNFFAGDLERFGLAVVFGLAFGVIYLLVLRLAFTKMLAELAGYVPGSKYVKRILFLD